MLLALIPLAHCAGAGVARLWGEVGELGARRALWNRPWDHDALHWSGPAHAAVLHGRTLPRRGAVVTAGRGWCACPCKTSTDSGTGAPGPTDG